ncbi:hypothetical protein [Marinomonas mediterranea]|uniref:hypothetical protein n=1 Tax=Marinomonas mediterranea TaxID=119864 RepID=UPI0023492C9D|nr:hypothetical protein [Marinomonas mediterranea]WCN07796.1 hypothetical protein GV055_02080 [Marinomonas mediterranea]
MKKYNKYILLSALAVSLILSAFFVGRFSAQAESFSVQNAKMMDALYFVSNDVSDIRMLQAVFEAYEESPEIGREKTKRFIAIQYQGDKRIRGLLGEDYGPNNMIYMKNSAIEKFLLEHPLLECKDVKAAENLDCNLSNIFNY